MLRHWENQLPSMGRKTFWTNTALSWCKRKSGFGKIVQYWPRILFYSNNHHAYNRLFLVPCRSAFTYPQPRCTVDVDTQYKMSKFINIDVSIFDALFFVECSVFRTVLPIHILHLSTTLSLIHFAPFSNPKRSTLSIHLSNVNQAAPELRRIQIDMNSKYVVATIRSAWSHIPSVEQSKRIIFPIQVGTRCVWTRLYMVIRSWSSWTSSRATVLVCSWMKQQIAPPSIRRLVIINTSVSQSVLYARNISTQSRWLHWRFSRGSGCSWW